MDNSAKRLLRILEAGKEEKINKDASCRQVWMSLLDVPNNNEVLLLSRVGKTMALVGEIETELKALNKVNIESYLGWLPTIKLAFSNQQLKSPWATFINQIDDHTFNYLNNSSDILDMGMPQKTFNIDNVLELSNSISELLSEILESDLPDNVKIFMSSKLREIQIAIDEFHITGNTPIIEAVESFVGHVMLHQDLKQSSAGSETADKFWGFMGKLLIATTITVNGLLISSEVKKYFPPATIIELENGLPENKELENNTKVENLKLA